MRGRINRPSAPEVVTAVNARSGVATKRRAKGIRSDS
jgi:hypothetical protein